MQIEEEVLDFIKKRFQVDCKWTDGNCYYFALILKDRFGGEIYYIPIEGHFVCKIGDSFYDFHGKHEVPLSVPITLKELEKRDDIWYNRIRRDCIM